MRFSSAERAPGAFQQPITRAQALAMCRRAFGEHVTPTSVAEFGYGTYNSTYRVDLGEDGTVILRVAPEPRRQARFDREMMRNEHASIPYLAPVAALMPRTLAVDFTHEIVGRDYLFQTVLDGVPAPDGLTGYPRGEWDGFFRQLGAIARRIHAVRGPHFGRVGGPWFGRWSDACASLLADIASDIGDAGIDSSDVREAAAAAARHPEVLDEITEPRLLHGDLWTVNVMVAPGAPEPAITGICDCDRTLWGDPAADWCIYRAGQRPGTERDAFWDSYGALPGGPHAARRALIYEAIHLGGLRIEAHRLAKPDDVQATYDAMRGVTADLAA